jgi:hypothetical protein
MIAAAILLAAAATDPVSGTWEGTSLCQVKPSPCHDEHAIYRFTRTAPHRYRLDAYKVVNGQEQFMGPLDLSLDASGHALTGSNRDRAGVVHPWQFTVRGTHISGKALTGPNGQVFRLIEVDKR